MIRKIWAVSAALVATMPLHAQAPAPASSPAPAPAPAAFDAAAGFGMRQSVQSIALSPDGRTIAYVEPAAGQASNIYTVDIENPEPRLAIRGSEHQRFGGCGFVSSRRLVCSTYSIQDVGGELIPFSSLFAFDTDGGNLRELGQRRSNEALYIRASSGSIIDYLPGNDDQVMMSQVFVPEQTTGSLLRRTGEGLGVVRVNTSNLRTAQIEAPRPRAAGFITDGWGNVRIMAVDDATGTGMSTGRIVFQYRPVGSNDWQDFGTYDSTTGQGPYPVAVDHELNAAYVFERLNGREALYRVSLDGSMRKELVASHPHVDVDGLIRIGRRNRVVGVSWATERREAVYLDPELQRIAEQLHRALPNSPLINFEDASEDESRLLIWAGSDTDPGKYYLYDRASRRLTPLMAVRPELETVRLASVRPVTYRAADGTNIPGYLTLPPEGTGRGLPAIVMPHGGPGSRDEWGFDWLAQYYANGGYAVLQPNFRGSAGYGSAWFQNNGFQSWQTAIGDINDAGRWLVSEGIADPAKLAIVGWSYGGYAALQSNVVDPNLFKAVVGIAPVTDLTSARDAWRNWGNAAVVRDFFGTGPHLQQGSPAQNAAAIRAPVLLFHGTMDRNVLLQQSRLMDERLRGAGRASELVVYDGLDHQLDNSAARIDMLRRTDAFLRRTLGIQ